MVYRSINMEAPNDLTAVFDRLSDISVRELRNTNTDLQLPRLEAPGALLTEGHNYGTTLALKLRKHHTESNQRCL